MLTRRTFLTGITALAASVGSAWALVDDAHSMALELATGQVARGYKIREDYWKGESKNDEPKNVTAQLFRGNEYWFWLGTDLLGTELTIKILDSKGEPVTGDTAKTDYAIGLRIRPPRSGSYTIIITVKPKPEELEKDKCHWALVYGYR
jgi:hypothetical protein